MDGVASERYSTATESRSNSTTERGLMAASASLARRLSRRRSGGKESRWTHSGRFRGYKEEGPGLKVASDGIKTWGLWSDGEGRHVYIRGCIPGRPEMVAPCWPPMAKRANAERDGLVASPAEVGSLRGPVALMPDGAWMLGDWGERVPRAMGRFIVLHDRCIVADVGEAVDHLKQSEGSLVRTFFSNGDVMEGHWKGDANEPSTWRLASVAWFFFSPACPEERFAEAAITDVDWEVIPSSREGTPDSPPDSSPEFVRHVMEDAVSPEDPRDEGRGSSVPRPWWDPRYRPREYHPKERALFRAYVEAGHVGWARSDPWRDSGRGTACREGSGAPKSVA